MQDRGSSANSRLVKAVPIAAVAAALAQSSAAHPQRAADVGINDTELTAAIDALALPDDAAVLVAAGDIARCDELEPARATAALVAAIVAAADSAIVVTAGDHAYDRDTREEFARCYGPTWGRFEEITRPSPGNHDYDTEDGAPFYE
jgi:hypothetical protein